MEQELKLILRAYNQAQQTIRTVGQELGALGQTEKQTAAATDRLNQAFAAAMRTTQGWAQTASGLLVPLSAVERTERRVEQASRQVEQQTRRTAQAMRQQSQETRGSAEAMEQLFQALGALGVVAGLERALSGVISTHRQFSATITQASIVAEDYTGALERQALAATQGVHGPTQLAQVYRELGAAGLEANEVLAATPAVLNLATAAMIDETDAAQALIAAASSFRIPFTEASRVSDAFAEAMNRTTLGGRDLVYALASIGPVAAIANQGLGETIAAVAALRAAGASAQDAATSVRSAMLHLSNPTEEAAELIQHLGIQIYDAQGNMKQWSDIVAEFERALAGYNQQARNMILATIFGSDGIRAMASSLQMGSDNLRQLARDLENAEGAAASAARTMNEQFSGALNRLAGNWERVKEIVGQDLEPEMLSVTKFLNTLASGFVHLDDTTRGLIETILGTAGLVVALASVARILQMLGPGFEALVGLAGQVRIALVGLATGAQAITLSLGSVAGVLGIVAAALGVGYLAWRTYHAGQVQATLAGGETAKQLKDQAQRIRELTGELEYLASRTNPTVEEQNRLRDVTEELARLSPQAAMGIDEQTGAIRDLGAVLRGANRDMETFIAQSERLAEAAARAAKYQLDAKKRELEQIEKQIADLDRALEQQHIGRLRTLLNMHGAAPPTFVLEAASERMAQLLMQARDLQAEIERLQGILDAAKPRVGSADTALLQRAGLTSTGGGGGGGTGLPGGGGSDWLDTWRASLERTLDTLAPYEQALARVSGRLDLLNAKTAYYVALLRDGRAGVEAVMAVERNRQETIRALTEHQQELHRTNEAYRAMVATLAQEQQRLDAMLSSGKINRDQHAEASRKLRDEIDRLNQAIARNSAEWWRDELAIAQAGDTLKQVTELLEQDARKALEEYLRRGREELERFNRALDELFARFDRAREARNLEQVLAGLRETAETLQKVLSGAPLDPTPLFTGGNLGDAARTAASRAQELVQQILSGSFRPDWNALLKRDEQGNFLVSRDEFKTALEGGLNRLGDLLKEAEQLAEPLARELQSIVAGLDQQIRGIQDVLDEFDAQEAAQRRTDAVKELTRALDALRGIKPDAVLPSVEDVERLADAVQSIRLDDLGALDPEAFAEALRSNLSRLQGYAQQARDYLQAAADAIDSELEAIDRQIRRIDERLQRDLERLQAELDAIDAEERQDERLKAEEEYQKRRKALQDQVAWLMMQGEEKYAFEIAALRRQLADEEARWQEQLAEWEREDRRQRIRDEMEALRQQAEERKRALEERRRELEEQQALLNRALEAILAVIGAEQQGLVDLARQRQEDLRDQQGYYERAYQLLQESLGNIKKAGEELVAEWKRVADERKRIEEDAWNNEENGIKAIMDKGITETLQMMAERDPEWFARGESMMDALIRGIRSKEQSLRDAIADVNRALAELRDAEAALDQAQAAAAGASGIAGTSSQTVTVDVPGFASGAVLFRPVSGLMALAERQPEAVAPLDWLEYQIRDLVDRSVRQTLVAVTGGQQPGSITREDLAAAVREALEGVRLQATGPLNLDGKSIGDYTAEYIFGSMRQDVRKRRGPGW